MKQEKRLNSGNFIDKNQRDKLRLSELESLNGGQQKENLSLERALNMLTSQTNTVKFLIFKMFFSFRINLIK